MDGPHPLVEIQVNVCSLGALFVIGDLQEARAYGSS